MVNAQQEINKRFPNKDTEKINIKDVHLEGKIDLSEYKELKDIHLVSCQLNDYSFLDTVSNKAKLIILDLGGNNSTSDFSALLWKITQFINLEWVSLDGIKVNSNEVRMKQLGYFPKCHTFAVNKNITIGWEYSLDVLQRAYWDEERNKQFLKYKKDNQIRRSQCKHEIDLEKENDKLKKQTNELNQKLTNQQTISKESQKEVIELEKAISRLKAEKELLENNLKEKEQEKQLAIKEIKNVNEKHLSELNEEIQEIGSELLDRKKKDLEQLLNETKNKLEENLHDYLDILLLSPDKSLISEKAKRNLNEKINANELQKIMLLQHEVNHLEQRISNSHYQTQIEVLPPSYN